MCSSDLDATKAPVLQEHVAVGDPGQPGQAVLGDEHRAPRFLRVFHEFGHARCRGQIQIARRLVEQQVRGVHGPDAPPLSQVFRLPVVAGRLTTP